MKKIFLFGIILVFLFAVSLVSAQYYQVGEQVGLPFLETSETSDLDFSDGIGKYVYCSLEFNAPNTDEGCHTADDLRKGTCDMGSFVPLAWGHLPNPDYVGVHNCGLYEPTSPTGHHEPFKINLSEGTSELAISIVSADMTFDEATESWVLGEVKLIDSLTVTYKTIPEPSDDFMRTLIRALLDIICKIYQFGWCTS